MSVRLFAQEMPDTPAAIAASSGQVLTWSQLDMRSTQLARLCRGLGLQRGDHIAVFMENNLAYFEVMWAALRSGLYLTTVNRYLTTEEAGYILKDCEARVLVTSKTLTDVAMGLNKHAPKIERWLMVGEEPCEGYENYDQALASQLTEPLDDEIAGGMMLYSSGTTGRPKGIKRPLPECAIDADDAFPIRNLLRNLWKFDRKTVYLSPAPLYHSAPAGFCFTTQLLGGTVVMMEGFDAMLALEFIERYHVTHSQWVPTMFSRMLKLPTEERGRHDLSSHRVAIHAAAPCPTRVKEIMMDWWGPILHEYYGGTELNGLTYASPEDWLQHPGTVGKALLGVLHICDDDGRELPNGEVGLVYFEQDAMPFHYHNAPEKTKSAQHPAHPGWSALGDVGYLNEEGFLFLTDRATFMIISGGVNIYPQEVEDSLILHPKIEDVAVFGVPNEDMGEEVKAVVQPVPGIRADERLANELLAYARENLARFKCPRSIDFEKELPRLPTGKLYKRLLKDRYWGQTDSRIV